MAGFCYLKKIQLKNQEIDEEEKSPRSLVYYLDRRNMTQKVNRTLYIIIIERIVKKKRSPA